MVVQGIALAGLGARAAISAASLKASRQYSVSILGYDFVGLAIRLGLFLVVGILIQSYFTATIKGGNWLAYAAGLFNIKFPVNLPDWITKLFTVGFSGIAFWQILQFTAILIVVLEYMQYNRSLKEEGKHPNATTTAVFLIIGLALSFLVFPSTIQRIKEMKILSNASRTDVTKGFGGESI